MSPAYISPENSQFNSNFTLLRSVRWRLTLGVLPSSLSYSIDDLRRATGDNRRRYAGVRRELLIDPHVSKFGDDSLDLEIDNPLSQNPDSTWGRFFQNAELEKMVDKDLSRLYPEHESYFQTPGCQGLLRRILLLWCLKHPEFSYRQGMHELLAPLLYVLHSDIQYLNEVRKLYEEHFIDKFDEVLFHESHDFSFKLSSNGSDDDSTNSLERPRKRSSLNDLDADVQTIILLSDPYGADGELGVVLSERFLEHDAYCMFDALMSGAGGVVAMAEFFCPSSATATQTSSAPVIEASLSLYHLLSMVDSSLYTHLVELGVEPQYFALRWFRVLFGREFSLDNLLAIWDEIFSFDNGKSVKDNEHDPGILNSPRGAFISAMAVSMMLNIRSSLLATEYATSCLQRLLNYPEDVDLDKLIGKAKSLVPLAVQANAPSCSTSAVRRGNHDNHVGVLVHSHSLPLDPNSPKSPSSPVPERYWEEKWRVTLHEEETKKQHSPKSVPSRRKSWTDKMKLRLSRTASDPCPSKNINRRESSVRRSLLEDLSRQLNFGENSEEIEQDGSSSAVGQDAEQESEAFISKRCSESSTASDEHSPVFSDPESSVGNDSEKSSTSSSISQGIIDDGFQNSCSCQFITEDEPPVSFSPDAGAYGSIGDDYIPTETTLAISGADSCEVSGNNYNLTKPPLTISDANACGVPVNNYSPKEASSAISVANTCVVYSPKESSSMVSDADACEVIGNNCNPTDSSPMVLDASACGDSGKNCGSAESSPTVSKERKSLSGKFQWLWKFGRHMSGEGTSDSRVDGEDAKFAANVENLEGNKVGPSIDEVNNTSVNMRMDGCDQNLICTLRNLGQSMLENIQVIESAFQQERSQALVEKGQVTALTALKELRKISNLLREM